MTDYSDTQTKSRADLKAALEALKLVGNNTVSGRNGAIARNVVDEEREQYGPVFGGHYDLADGIRDRLLVHARQDAAHVLLNSISTLETVTQIHRLLKFAVFLLVVSLAVIGWQLNH